MINEFDPEGDAKLEKAKADYLDAAKKFFDSAARESEKRLGKIGESPEFPPQILCGFPIPTFKETSLRIEMAWNTIRSEFSDAPDGIKLEMFQRLMTSEK